MDKKPQNFTPLPESLLEKPKTALELSKQFTRGRIPTAVIERVLAVRQEQRRIDNIPIKAAQERATIANRLIRIKNKKVIIKHKMDAFLKEFVNNGGNATKAMQTIAPHSSYHSANTSALAFMKQVRGVGRAYLEKKGHSYGKLLDIAMEKIKTSKTPEWWDRIMKIAEYEDFITKDKGGGHQTVNIIQSHKDLASSYIEGEVEDAEVVEE